MSGASFIRVACASLVAPTIHRRVGAVRQEQRAARRRVPAARRFHASGTRAGAGAAASTSRSRRRVYRAHDRLAPFCLCSSTASTSTAVAIATPVLTMDPLGGQVLTGMTSSASPRARADGGTSGRSHLRAERNARQGGSGYSTRIGRTHPFCRGPASAICRGPPTPLGGAPGAQRLERIHHLTRRRGTTLSADAIEHARLRLDRRDDEHWTSPRLIATGLAPPWSRAGAHRRPSHSSGAERGKVTPAALRSAHATKRCPMLGRDAPSTTNLLLVCMHAIPAERRRRHDRAPAARRERSARYWGSLGSPCVGLFLPCLDGEFRVCVVRGGEHAAGLAGWGSSGCSVSWARFRDDTREGPRVWD